MTDKDLWVGVGYADRSDDFVELEKNLQLIFGKAPEYRPAERWAGDNDLIQIILNTPAYVFLLGMLADRYGNKILDMVEKPVIEAARKGIQGLVKVLSRHAAHGGELSFSIPLPIGNAQRAFAIWLPKGDSDELIKAATAILKITPEIDRFLAEHFDPSRHVSSENLLGHYFRLDGAQLELADDRGTTTLTVKLKDDGTVTSEVQKTF
ncbi:hypothetical protein J2W92_002346 [Rhizobium leguminosarum]